MGPPLVPPKYFLGLCGSCVIFHSFCGMGRGQRSPKEELVLSLFFFVKLNLQQVKDWTSSVSTKKHILNKLEPSEKLEIAQRTRKNVRKSVYYRVCKQLKDFCRCTLYNCEWVCASLVHAFISWPQFIMSRSMAYVHFLWHFSIDPVLQFSNGILSQHGLNSMMDTTLMMEVSRLGPSKAATGDSLT